MANSKIVLRSASGSRIVLRTGSGPRGPAGVGVLAGGTTGQYYRKASDADYDGEWVTVDGADSHFSQSFGGSSVTVTHNLGKYPAVTVFDSAGDEVEGDIQHLNTNSFTLSFSASFSGVVNCN